MTRLLVVEARYYEAIAQKLRQGAEAELARMDDVEADFVEVPGALEIPTAIGLAAAQKKYDGYVALGCVIRGETLHYELVSTLSAWGLAQLGIERGLAIGNGILTVENEAQAVRRADPASDNKGAGAVLACLALVDLKKSL